MALRPEWETTRIAAVGMGGFGKTTFIHQWIRAQKKYDFLFVFDHDGQFAFRNGVNSCYSKNDILAALKKSGIVIFNPLKMFTGKMHEAAIWFCQYVFSISDPLAGNKLFYCDELQVLCNSKNIWLGAILQQGRNYALDFACCTLYFGSIDLAVRGQFTRIVAFHTEEPGQLKYLSGRGLPATEIFNLPKFCWVSRDTSGALERGKLPERRQ